MSVIVTDYSYGPKDLAKLTEFVDNETDAQYKVEKLPEYDGGGSVLLFYSLTKEDAHKISDFEELLMSGEVPE